MTDWSGAVNKWAQAVDAGSTATPHTPLVRVFNAPICEA